MADLHTHERTHHSQIPQRQSPFRPKSLWRSIRKLLCNAHTAHTSNSISWGGQWPIAASRQCLSFNGNGPLQMTIIKMLVNKFTLKRWLMMMMRFGVSRAMFDVGFRRFRFESAATTTTNSILSNVELRDTPNSNAVLKWVRSKQICTHYRTITYRRQIRCIYTMYVYDTHGPCEYKWHEENKKKTEGKKDSLKQNLLNAKVLHFWIEIFRGTYEKIISIIGWQHGAGEHTHTKERQISVNWFSCDFWRQFNFFILNWRYEIWWQQQQQRRRWQWRLRLADVYVTNVWRWRSIILAIGSERGFWGIEKMYCMYFDPLSFNLPILIAIIISIFYCLDVWYYYYYLKYLWFFFRFFFSILCVTAIIKFEQKERDLWISIEKYKTLILNSTNSMYTRINSGMNTLIRFCLFGRKKYTEK